MEDMNITQVKKNNRSIILQAGKKVYFVFGIILGAPFLVGLLALYKMSSQGYFEAGLLKIIALWLLGSTFTFLWLRVARIELSDEAIFYRSIWRFGRIISLTFSEINKAEIKIGVFKYSDRLKPTVRLELTPKPLIKKPPIIINLKILSENDAKKIFDFLDSKGIRLPK